MKFRKKPVVVEALQWTGKNVSELSMWASQADFAGRKARGELPGTTNANIELPLDLVSLGDGMFALEIKTLEGVHRADVGDWIICGVQGEFYPCKAPIFEKTYEPA